MFGGGFYLFVGAVVIVAITHWVYRWRNPKCNGALPLPPGSMGWPLLGETLHFFSPSPTYDMHPFVKHRIQRFGTIFKTSLVGRPLIVSADTDLNRLIFQREDELFRSWYPDTISKLFGRLSLGYLQGFMHKYLRNMVQGLFGVESLKKMIPEVVQGVNGNLEKWSGLMCVEMKESTAKMIFGLTAKKLISYDSETSLDDLRENFNAFIQGLISFPLDIPGTAYHSCLQGRKKVMVVLKNMLQKRRESPREGEGDFFNYVLEELNRKDTVLNEEIALDLIFLLLFASFETISGTLTLGMKFLIDHPLVLEELTKENEEIIKRRENPDSGLTWSEYKSMKFTFQFINETLRLANIAPGMFRKALTDVQFKGYTIPAGWSVMVCPPALHLDANRYKDPLDFNPWRWEGVDIHGASRNFIAFGGGMRFCSGSDFAKVQMAVFLHCLVTKYRMKLIKGGEVLRTPGLQFPNGLHLQISKKEN